MLHVHCFARRRWQSRRAAMALASAGGRLRGPGAAAAGSAAAAGCSSCICEPLRARPCCLHTCGWRPLLLNTDLPSAAAVHRLGAGAALGGGTTTTALGGAGGPCWPCLPGAAVAVAKPRLLPLRRQQRQAVAVGGRQCFPACLLAPAHSPLPCPPPPAACSYGDRDRDYDRGERRGYGFGGDRDRDRDWPARRGPPGGERNAGAGGAGADCKFRWRHQWEWQAVPVVASS